MVAVLRPDRCARRLHRELPARAVEPLHLDAGEGRRAAALEIQDMRAAVRDDLLARSAVDVDGELVAHGARRQKHRRLLAQQLGGHRAEAVNAGIVAEIGRASGGERVCEYGWYRGGAVWSK